MPGCCEVASLSSRLGSTSSPAAQYDLASAWVSSSDLGFFRTVSEPCGYKSGLCCANPMALQPMWGWLWGWFGRSSGEIRSGFSCTVFSKTESRLSWLSDE